MWSGLKGSCLCGYNVAHSSRGPGRVPLKDEITGSNPVCATKVLFTTIIVAKIAGMVVSFCDFATNLRPDTSKHNITYWHYTLKMDVK